METARNAQTAIAPDATEASLLVLRLSMSATISVRPTQWKCFQASLSISAPPPRCFNARGLTSSRIVMQKYVYTRPMGYTTAVLGASGYAGGELLRLLAGHPALDLVGAAASRSAGRPVAQLHPNLAGWGALDRSTPVPPWPSMWTSSSRVCRPASWTPFWMGPRRRSSSTSRTNIGPPRSGCTASRSSRGRRLAGRQDRQPGLLPHGDAPCARPVRSGRGRDGPGRGRCDVRDSGAGRKGEDHLSFATAASDAGAYGTTSHRHIPEMESGVESFGGTEVTISFTPHLVPMARGLVATVRARLARDIDDAEALDILKTAYGSERFVQVVDGWPHAKALAGSNLAHVGARVDARGGWLVCSAAIDNLGKGAAGQALQNANVALGLDEHAGLDRSGCGHEVAEGVPQRRCRVRYQGRGA